MPHKGWRGHFFEDFALNSTLKCPTPRTLHTGDISNYIAFTGDRTPRFCGPSGLVHPLITFHTVFGQTVRQVSLNARANLGYAGMRWLAPVCIGDTLSMEIEIVGLKENSSQKTGIVYVHNVATNQHGVEVMRFWRWVMVKKRSEAPTAYLEKPVVPDLPKVIAAKDLKIFPAPMPAVDDTGGRWAWEDYEVEERVLHFDGMTVNPSDHMSFTRLFQNSAKIHFDAHFAKGKPLVYGGVPISYGYALALNGFENRLGLCGINGGVHANPVYSGDTLYAFTDILAKVELDHPQLGALRLRMICVKNEDPSELSDPKAYAIRFRDESRPGRYKYRENAVLDLDYWELIPRRDALRQRRT